MKVKEALLQEFQEIKLYEMKEVSAARGERKVYLHEEMLRRPYKGD